MKLKLNQINLEKEGISSGFMTKPELRRNGYIAILQWSMDNVPSGTVLFHHIEGEKAYFLIDDEYEMYFVEYFGNEYLGRIRVIDHWERRDYY